MGIRPTVVSAHIAAKPLAWLDKEGSLLLSDEAKHPSSLYEVISQDPGGTLDQGDMFIFPGGIRDPSIIDGVFASIHRLAGAGENDFIIFIIKNTIPIKLTSEELKMEIRELVASNKMSKIRIDYSQAAGQATVLGDRIIAQLKPNDDVLNRIKDSGIFVPDHITRVFNNINYATLMSVGDSLNEKYPFLQEGTNVILRTKANSIDPPFSASDLSEAIMHVGNIVAWEKIDGEEKAWYPMPGYAILYPMTVGIKKVTKYVGEGNKKMPMATWEMEDSGGISLPGNIVPRPRVASVVAINEEDEDRIKIASIVSCHNFLNTAGEVIPPATELIDSQNAYLIVKISDIQMCFDKNLPVFDLRLDTHIEPPSWNFDIGSN